MASVDGITVAKAQQIQDASVVSGFVDSSGILYLVQGDGTQINAGQVADYAPFQAHIDSTAAHGATGAVVGTTNLQTLTQKTFVTPTIASFVNAQHDHNGSAGGGALYIGKADTPAPITTLTAQTLTDADATAGTAKVMASIALPPGRWLILGTVEGVTMPSANQTRMSYDLKTTGPSLIAKPVSGASDTAAINGGRTIFGWADFANTQTVTFTILKNGAGGLITNSTSGQLVAIRMG